MKNKTVAYIRVSTDKQTSENQRNEISRYATKEKIIISQWFDFEVSSRKSDEKRGITELLEVLKEGDTLIVSELSRLGRSTIGVLTLIDTLNNMGVTTILLRQGLTLSNKTSDSTSKIMVTLFSMFAELERDIISARTKEALASRKGTGELGHRKGDLLKSKYDKDISKIIELRDLGLSIQKVINHLGYGTLGSLNTYLNKRFTKNKLLNGYVLKDALQAKYEIVNGALSKKSI